MQHLFSLVNIYFIPCTMDGAKPAPSHEHTPTDLEMKIRMIHKYGSG
jgi:hypothetical protein